jgi:hypothetical protein
LLVRNPDKAKENELVEVLPTGARVAVKLTDDEALAFANVAAQAFGVGPSKTVPFDTERAKKDVKGEGDTKTKGKKGKKPEATDG